MVTIECDLRAVPLRLYTMGPSHTLLIMKLTPLHPCHQQLSGKMVDFCGWSLPIHYGSQLQEHLAVRIAAGLFDVSHMSIIDISGVDAQAWLRRLLSNDVAKLNLHPVGKALYSTLLNDNGGIIDDLIVYRRDASYRLVTNAATFAKDWAWLQQQALGWQVALQHRSDLAIIAVQGPSAIHSVTLVKPHLAEALAALKSFESLEDGEWQYARTGYTGEKGLEILMPNPQAVEFWQALIDQGVMPCGLAARDTLRLEAGLNLYGHDMDEAVSPLECNTNFAVDLKDEQRVFMGKSAYIQLKQRGTFRRQIGLMLANGGILREGQRVFCDDRDIGVITSGGYSATLKSSVAMARVDHPIEHACVEIRGQRLAVNVVPLPFIGKH